MPRRLFTILSALLLLPLAWLCGCAATPELQAKWYFIDKAFIVGERYQLPTTDGSELTLTLLEIEGKQAKFSLVHAPPGNAAVRRFEDWGEVNGKWLRWWQIRGEVSQPAMPLMRVEGNTAVVRLGFNPYFEPAAPLGRCPTCGYVLRSAPLWCPECGREAGGHGVEARAEEAGAGSRGGGG